MFRSVGSRARHFILTGAVAVVLGATALPALPALAWHYNVECNQFESGIDGTITFPAGAESFTVYAQERVDGVWQDVFLGSTTISPSPTATSASFSVSTLFGNYSADAHRVRNSATNEVSLAIGPCLILD